ncbi:MAG: hypothetical protein KKC75_00070 [Nanoarchaeota archaeon]|nr:hypothetical protein [Nanoarchaeota archaeon]MBU1005566.1 hypothetical protein [Nanoarchaeota archaeon]MBU1946051.1 hypothetical protein [Nanoarchaeota archaeon]
MDLKIINKKDNPLLSRIEVNAEVNFVNSPTPKKEDVKKKIASVEKADEKLVVIKKVVNTYGIGKIQVLAYIYSSEEELKNIEPKKKDKGAKAEAPKAEAAESKEEAKGE